MLHIGIPKRRWPHLRQLGRALLTVFKRNIFNTSVSESIGTKTPHARRNRYRMNTKYSFEGKGTNFSHSFGNVNYRRFTIIVKKHSILINVEIVFPTPMNHNCSNCRLDLTGRGLNISFDRTSTRFRISMKMLRDAITNYVAQLRRIFSPLHVAPAK